MSNVTDPHPTPAAAPGGRLLLSGLLRRDALDGAGQGLGRIIDVIVRLREDDYPAVTGLVAKVISVFVIIGASFGPICGAMLVDYVLSKGTWTGPRAGFNPAGWIAWALGFIVGILPNLGVAVPAAPVLAFIVGVFCCRGSWT